MPANFSSESRLFGESIQSQSRVTPALSRSSGKKYLNHDFFAAGLNGIPYWLR